LKWVGRQKNYFSKYIQKLPKVNPDFARKLMEAKEEAAAGNKKKAKVRYVVLKFNMCRKKSLKISKG
jgi:hypothetical protein